MEQPSKKQKIKKLKKDTVYNPERKLLFLLLSPSFFIQFMTMRRQKKSNNAWNGKRKISTI